MPAATRQGACIRTNAILECVSAETNSPTSGTMRSRTAPKKTRRIGSGAHNHSTNQLEETRQVFSQPWSKP